MACPGFPKESFVNAAPPLVCHWDRHWLGCHHWFLELHIDSTGTPEVEYSIPKQDNSHYSTQPSTRVLPPCAFQNLEPRRICPHIITSLTPKARDREYICLVLAMKAPLVSLKFKSSTNSPWHYFSGGSHRIERNFYSVLTSGSSAFQESSLGI